jgi:FkbM family methyltransferase
MPNLFLSLTARFARLLPQPVRQAVYRAPLLARLVRGGLNRAAPHGLTRIPVAAGGLAGMSLLLDLQTEKDYWLGTYEPELQAAVAELARPGMVAYDIGANIGYVTLLLARATGGSGRVYAFEALPDNVERLRANLALNQLESRVNVISGAVVDRAGPVEFLIGPSGGMGKAAGSVGRQGIAYARTQIVLGIVLDEYIFENDHPAPQIVKIDIEGGEVLALPGMRRVLAEARPLVLLELHGPEAARRTWEILVSAGYRICRMAPGYPAAPSLEALDWKAYLAALPLD